MEMSLGKRIRELRTMKNLSQEAVAEKCNVSTPAVPHWETDSSSPNKAHRKLLADALGVHENDLYVAPEIPVPQHVLISEIVDCLKDMTDEELRFVLTVVQAARNLTNRN